MAEYLIHVRDKWAVIWTEKGWKMTLESQYVRGLKPPRYPVPAITTGCVFFPEYINLNRYNGNVGMYGPGYEVVHAWNR